MSGFTTRGQLLLRPDLEYNRREGEYVVAWSTEKDEGFATFARRIGPRARPLGAETEIDASSEPGSTFPDIAVAPGGHHVIGFERGFGTDSRVYRRRVGAHLRARGLRSISTSAPAAGPSLAYSRAAERFVAAWLQAVPPEQDDNFEVFSRQL